MFWLLVERPCSQSLVSPKTQRCENISLFEMSTMTTVGVMQSSTIKIRLLKNFVLYLHVCTNSIWQTPHIFHVNICYNMVFPSLVSPNLLNFSDRVYCVSLEMVVDLKKGVQRTFKEKTSTFCFFFFFSLLISLESIILGCTIFRLKNLTELNGTERGM